MGTTAPGTIFWIINISVVGYSKKFATFGDLAGVLGLMGKVCSTKVC